MFIWRLLPTWYNSFMPGTAEYLVPDTAVPGIRVPGTSAVVPGTPLYRRYLAYLRSPCENIVPCIVRTLRKK